MIWRSKGSEQFLDLGVVPNTLMPTILICHRLARQQHRGNRRCAGNTLHRPRAATIGAAGAKLLAGMAWTKTASEMKRIITAV
jgi:hypothetical protein